MFISAIAYFAGALGVGGIVLAIAAFISFHKDIDSELSDFFRDAIRYWALSVLFLELGLVIWALSVVYSK